MIDDIFFHGHIHAANKSLQWFPSDTKELYLKSNFNHKKIWSKKKVSYDFNSYGFRCDEFTDEDNIVFLGCSHTLGVGLPFEETYAHIVSKSLNLKLHNLAIGGGALDSCFRFAYHWLSILKPKLVVCQMPEPSRLELRLRSINEDGRDRWKTDMPLEYSHKFYKAQWIYYPEQWILHNHKNLLSIRHLCKEAKIKLIELDQSLWSKCEHDLARDLQHFGTKTNREMADRLLGKIHEQEY